VRDIVLPKSRKKAMVCTLLGKKKLPSDRCSCQHSKEHPLSPPKHTHTYPFHINFIF
jgi:hypothetical protein